MKWPGGVLLVCFPNKMRSLFLKCVFVSCSWRDRHLMCVLVPRSSRTGALLSPRLLLRPTPASDVWIRPRFLGQRFPSALLIGSGPSLAEGPERPKTALF